MNFPGLEPSWNWFYDARFRSGKIAPWDRETCGKQLREGAGVLVVASTALGDSLLCTPLLKTLADTIGAERLGFLVRTPFVELYRDVPWIGNLYTVDGKFRGLTRLKKALAGTPFRIALIANCTEPDLVPWLWHCGIRGFLRYRTRWSRWHEWFANQEEMRPPTSPEYATGHAVENNLAMAEALGIKPTTRRLLLSKAAEGPIRSPRLIIIHPGASRTGKCWPLDNWAAVAREIKQRVDCQFAITGSGHAEVEMAAALDKLLPPPVRNLAGKLPLSQLADLQRSAALFLSSDTGPYHLAVAVGCPTVTLFAPRDRGSSIEACGPHLAPAECHVALQTEGFQRKVSEIPVDAVLAAARRILEIGAQ